jgi:nucleoid-associated protein YgaU
MAARRGRIPAARVTSFLAELGDLPVTMQLPLTFAEAAAAVHAEPKAFSCSESAEFRTHRLKAVDFARYTQTEPTRLPPSREEPV